MAATSDSGTTAQLQTLPGDDARQIMWGFADRYDLQMVVQAARSVARGVVARLVAEGARNTHEWTDEKNSLLAAFDEAGVTAAFMEPDQGGFIQGPKNLVLALLAYELAWVDGGAATCSLASDLALAPIHEKGTPEQQQTYMGRSVPPGLDGRVWRGAFCLTEPLPYVGVDTGVLSGTMRVVEWEEGEEPILQVEKRGRFITNMDFANFVTAAVDSDDERIKGSCMIILEEGDEGQYDRGATTHKMVHQLSSTRDPIFSLKVPASRIIGGYRVVDGVIVPNHNHGTVIEAVFRRTRVPVALMTSAKVLSAVEPVIRYQRERYRGGQSGGPGSPRFDLGLQQKEDALHRLVDVWATGEASASLGFATARLFDDYDPIEAQKGELLKAQGVDGPRAEMRALRKFHQPALEYLALTGRPAGERDEARLQELEGDVLVQFLVKDAMANVLVPACKLWNTGHGANVMREAVSLMGGYGITEDCPGFLGQKWMDAQLEATYEGPEAVQRRQLTVTMTNEIFLAQFREWIAELRRIATTRPQTGACHLASAMELWQWTLQYLRQAKDPDGRTLYRDQRQGVTFPTADALCWLLASRSQILDVLRLEAEGPQNPNLAEGLEGMVGFFTDLCRVQAARAAGEASRICSDLVFGYHSHPLWGEEGAGGYEAEDLDALEGVIPGIGACARSLTDVTEIDGSHPDKTGPCVHLAELEPFVRLRSRLDGCGTGGQLAKDRAAAAVSQVTIPEALDYPI
ncbi:acyl-CoA dehydrogenase family protein [Candidatus Latescibacterota bacterium]